MASALQTVVQFSQPRHYVSSHSKHGSTLIDTINTFIFRVFLMVSLEYFVIVLLYILNTTILLQSPSLSMSISCCLSIGCLAISFLILSFSLDITSSRETRSFSISTPDGLTIIWFIKGKL